MAKPYFTDKKKQNLKSRLSEKKMSLRKVKKK